MGKQNENSRLAKLTALVERHGGVRELCRKYPELNPDYLNQLLNGTRNFGERAAKKMAARMGLSEDYFEKAALSELQEALLAAADGLSPAKMAQLIHNAEEMKLRQMQEKLGPAG